MAEVTDKYISLNYTSDPWISHNDLIKRGQKTREYNYHKASSDFILCPQLQQSVPQKRSTLAS